MQFTKSFFALLAAVALAQAAVLSGHGGLQYTRDEEVSNATSEIFEKRTDDTVGGVLLCTDINWGGTCGYKVQPLGVCINLSAPYYETISSFGPDPNTKCFAYSSNNCDDSLWTFVNPGDDTGGLDSSNPWNDKITNFLCVSD